jgi:hypothetical protein
VLVALFFNRPGILYRRWYVIVGKLRVPVFELARKRETMGPKESLVKVYQEIAEGCFRAPKSPSILSKGGREQFWKTCRELIWIEPGAWKSVTAEVSRKQLLSSLLFSFNYGFFLSLSVVLALLALSSVPGRELFELWAVLFAIFSALFIRKLAKELTSGTAMTELVN